MSARHDETAKWLAEGLAHHRSGRLEAAAECYANAGEADPECSDAPHLLGVLALQRGRPGDARALISRAIEMQPRIAEYHGNLARVLRATGDLERAMRAEVDAYLLRRRHDPPDPNAETYRFTTVAKLRHDVEQLDYLIGLGRAEPAWIEARDAFAALSTSLEREARDDVSIALSPARLEALGGLYNRALHFVEPAPVERALHPNLDVPAIARAYRENAPGVVHFDGLLSDEALRELRRFCLESTIWHDFSHRGGYLGAYAGDGFDCALLGQIARELRESFAEILGPHPLTQHWAYKYDATMSGISLHADLAAVNLNFWISPDDACTDPEGGGLLVYPVEAPLEWDFAAYNADPDRVSRYLDARGARPIRIPHRQNRAVMFDSNLFHRSDAAAFRPGYGNRRINVTFLFGERGT